MRLVSLLTAGTFLLGNVLPAFSQVGGRFNYDTGATRDVVSVEGTVIGIYEPSQGVFKLIHIFKGSGFGRFEDPLTNTACHDVRDPVVLYIRTERKAQGGSCSLIDQDRGIYECQENGNRYYRDRDGYVLSKSILEGRLCVRVVTKDYLEKRVFHRRYPELVERQASSSGPIRNAYFEGLSFDSAAIITAQYMSVHGINEGILVLEDLHIEQRRSGKAFRRRITISYYEKPIYYAILKGVPVGRQLWNDYYIAEEGLGNLYDRKEFLVLRETKRGWGWLAAAVIGLAVAGLTGYFGGFLGLTFWQGFLASAIFQGTVYAFQIGSTGAITSNPINMQFAPDNFKKISAKPQKGRQQIADRVRNSDVWAMTSPPQEQQQQQGDMKCANAGWRSSGGGQCLSPLADMQRQKEALFQNKAPTFSHTEKANPYLYNY